MPELPEVETIKNSVSQAVKGAKITEVIVRQSQLREKIPDDFAKRIVGATIIDLKRIAKYMLIELNNGLTIIWHFGMSGKINISQADTDNFGKHDHVIIKTSKSVIVYNDVRRFGLIDLCESDKLTAHHCLNNIGLDPWDNRLNSEYLLLKFQKRKMPIKNALLLQDIICGIGNIYASEILYKARINPQRSSESVSKEEAEKIIKYTREILEESIKSGGSTIHDYHRPDGDIGHFQEKHCVYNKAGKPCPNCICDIKKTLGIRKIIQGGRSTYYCPTLQK